MKIEKPHTVRINGRTDAVDSFKDLKKGAELPARLLERAGAREAVLEIYGRRVRAEFVKGLPSAGNILLKLEEVKNNSYLFRIVGPSGSEESINHILGFTVFDPKAAGKNILHGLAKFFSIPPAGIFELNAFFLTWSRSRIKKKAGCRFFSINY